MDVDSGVVGDDLVDVVQLLIALCHCCTRSYGCLDVIAEVCRCFCLMLSWKM